MQSIVCAAVCLSAEIGRQPCVFILPSNSWTRCTLQPWAEPCEAFLAMAPTMVGSVRIAILSNDFSIDINAKDSFEFTSTWTRMLETPSTRDRAARGSYAADRLTHQRFWHAGPIPW